MGLKFGYGDIFAQYSESVFGTNVKANEKLEVEKKEVINNPEFTLSTEDFTPDMFKALINGGCNSSTSTLSSGLPLTTAFQKLISIKMEIQDLTALGTISLDDFQMDGNIYYYNPTTNECLAFDEIIYPNPIETGMVCNILAFSSDFDPMNPDRIAAGTDNILTITGMNFGDMPGAVEFQNADVPAELVPVGQPVPPFASTNVIDFDEVSGGEWGCKKYVLKSHLLQLPLDQVFFR